MAAWLALALSGCGDPAPPAGGPASPAVQATGPAYVGSAACADCHAAEWQAWHGSQHELAMQPATPATVLGEFSGTFSHNGVTSRFERRGDGFFVVTDGADGQLAEFPVRYAFGVWPLQQYLAELPGGRLQALPMAWDSRAAAAGGQRWFHVYGDEPIDHTDPLHWTRLSQNWETMCADCHATNLQADYDVAADRFSTRWAALDVACEACHGPAGDHVAWARAPDGSAARGLVVNFTERRGVSWQLDPATGNSRRSEPRLTRVEIDTCGPCHSRRAAIGQDWQPGQPYLDSYQPALVSPPLYHADGQVREEVYVYGSFMQSRMYQQGVTCSDCHEPHSLALRAPGPEVCARCHAADRYARTAHHRHPEDSAGANCIECHMPASTFMQVDVRHDHSFRIPRPALAMEFGTPLPCTNCHADRDARWAASVFPEPDTRDEQPVHWTRRLAGARELPLESRNLLLGLAADDTVPDIVRATAMAELDLSQDSLGVGVIEARLASREPMLRLGAALALQTASPSARARLGPALLDDPVKAVRLAAVMVLAPLGPEVLPPGAGPRFAAVVEEYLATQALNSERAEAHTNVGNLQRHLGRTELAEAAYRTALQVNAQFVPAYVNLADLYRAQGREADAEALLREGLAAVPATATAALHHALGLSLVRQGRLDLAAAELEAAAAAPEATPRFALAYALVLDAQGDNAAAREYLEASLRRFRDDPGLMSALANFYQRSGDLERAAALISRLRGSR